MTNNISVKIKSIRFENFKVFDDCTFDFTHDGVCQNFMCFHGPNGTGKSTILDAITIIFSRYDGRKLENIVALLGKSVRHVDGVRRAIYDEKSDFLITADIACSLGDYQVQIGKRGFIKDHPVEIIDNISNICFYAKYDQELHQFNLARDKWGIFKELFEAVTGFEIEETQTLFSGSLDSVQDEIIQKYVVGFMVQKPDEKISHKECSAGERKIIKSFSTLLNKENSPSIVCIDNAEMHVESGRHINLIQSMKKCFPDSQIFATTHSYQISRNFGQKSQLYDLRMIKASDLIQKEPWRLYVSDEIKEGLSKLRSGMSDTDQLIAEGIFLYNTCLLSDQDKCIIENAKSFLKKVSDLYVNDLVSYKPQIKIKGYSNRK